MSHGKDVIRTPPSRCLNCGLPVDALGTGNSAVEAKPSPGDVTVCIRCGAVMKIADDLRVRGMTEAEMDELVADTEWMNQVAKIVKMIYFVKHVSN